ncbi:hypothetical protein DRN69_01685 [Candidatus Pacearchaeota archaeon]|nr:MAG: hypothetical protein DRN69_01685 [Candidatus Pacearchaeota archaeon]
MELKTKLRRFGNSFGVIIPSNLIKTQGFREGEDVAVTIKGEGWTAGEVIAESKRQKLGKKFTLSTQEFLDKLDEELD